MNIKIEFINFKIEHQPKIELALKECVPHNTNLNYINIIYLDVDSLNNRLLLRKIKNKNSNPIFLLSSDYKVADLAWKSNVNYFFFIDDKINWINLFKEGLNQYFLKSAFLYQTKVSFKTHNGIYFINPNEVIYIRAFRNYTTIFLTNGEKYTISKNLKEIENTFSSFGFLERFGKSIMINLNQISKIIDKNIYFNNDKTVLSFPKYSNSFIYLKNRLIWNAIKK